MSKLNFLSASWVLSLLHKFRHVLFRPLCSYVAPIVSETSNLWWTGINWLQFKVPCLHSQDKRNLSIPKKKKKELEVADFADFACKQTTTTKNGEMLLSLFLLTLSLLTLWCFNGLWEAWFHFCRETWTWISQFANFAVGSSCSCPV